MSSVRYVLLLGVQAAQHWTGFKSHTATMVKWTVITLPQPIFIKGEVFWRRVFV